MFELSLEDLEAVATPEILARGVEYWENGHVCAMVASGERLSGSVTGTMGDYRVGVILRDGRLEGVCDCPYLKRFCKHAAAVAWGWLNEPERYLSSAQVAAKAASMSPGVLAGALVRLAERDPLGVAEALELKFDPFMGNSLALQRLTENLGRGNMDSVGWLKAWRHLLELLMVEPFNGNEAVWDRLLGYAVEFLGVQREPDPEFWEYFGQALNGWGGHIKANDGELPTCWGKLMEVYRDGDDDRRSRLDKLIVSAFSEDGCRLLLRALGFPVISEEGDWSVGLMTGLALRLSEDMRPLADWAMEDLSRVLLLMDALMAWEAWDWLQRIARESLRRFPPENGMLFRERLAINHCRAGEFRQALALFLSNFRERPGWAEYLRLEEVATAARDKERVVKEVNRFLETSRRWEVLARVLLHQGKLERLAQIGSELEPAGPAALEAASVLRGSFPEEAKDLWVRRIGGLLSEGSRRAVREAVPLIAEVKRLCREQGWEETWEMLRTTFEGMILDPIALRMTGSLLAEEEDEKQNRSLEAFR